MKYRVHQALHENIETGSVWLSAPKFPMRSAIKIDCPKTGKAVFCEVQAIDTNFRDHYVKVRGRSLDETGQFILINAWYRDRLGIAEELDELDLNISEESGLCGKFRACISHPQIVVRVASWLGFWSLLLGVAGLGLSIVALKKG